MDVLIIGIVAIVALVLVAYPLVSPRRQMYYLEDVLGLGQHKKLNYLYSQRELVYDNIRDLDQEYEMGKLSEADFARLRDGLLSEAQEIVRQIDQAHVRREIEDLIESDARKARRTR